jgi:hypothetical protein
LECYLEVKVKEFDKIFHEKVERLETLSKNIQSEKNQLIVITLQKKLNFLYEQLVSKTKGCESSQYF